MTKNDLYVVILAGGSGTRFWPSSRSALPKQFLSLVGNKTMLQETLSRMQSKVSGDQIYIVSNKRFAKIIEKQTKSYKVPKANILLEPSGKNTAPAIAWAASAIYHRNPDAVMVVLPSDHLIQNQKSYAATLDEAVCLANEGYLVTLGIVPTRPETGYGYIKGKKTRGQGKDLYEVEQFVEKPNLAKAVEYLKTKKYYWNSGMFIWKAEVVLNEFRQYLPEIHNAFFKSHSQKAVEKFWDGLTGISIDYGIMEKAKRVAVVPADIGWSDVGSWEALWEVSSKDPQGNVLRGDVVTHASKDNLVFAEKRMVAVVGLQDVVVVETPDVLLVCHRKQSQEVKAIVDHLKEKKRREI
ncbi:MAG: mannose-1-phosphate guanylyltransferase/mannose-6-phosphate isomerase [Candidatus Omnitrophica bacterium]|nr:mannose-1-phosphate guanylyltransferase/mannose-6-phosphate isomerase [Candidatus Omnitrophota bacterium]